MALLDVILGYDCNLACDYCTITPAMRARALSTEAVARALREGREAGYDAVSFTGGEPTMRADLLPLVREARRLGYADVKVQSNGLLLAHAPNLERLLDAGATRFHVSIHTHRAQAYERLVRRAGTHALLERALGNLVERAAPRGAVVHADLILKEDTYRHLPEAIDWLAARGVRRGHLWYVSLTDGNRDAVESLPRMVDVVPVMAEAFRRAAGHGVDLRSLHVPRCLLGEHAERAFDPGAGRVRVVTPEASFELAESKITPSVAVPACVGCRWEAVCPGVRRDYLEVFGDAEIAERRGVAPSIEPTRSLTLRTPATSSPAAWRRQAWQQSSALAVLKPRGPSAHVRTGPSSPSAEKS